MAKWTFQCADCGKKFEAGTTQAKRCLDCRREHKKTSRRVPHTEQVCVQCGSTFTPYRGGQKTCGRPDCVYQQSRPVRAAPNPLPTTRRCRNKDCIERFVPVNTQHWWHEPACRLGESQWTVEEILQEEGSLYPEATHLELAKRAFGQKNQALRKVTQLTSLRDYLTYEIKEFYDENPEFRAPHIPKAKVKTTKKEPLEIIVQLSDWQIGKWERGFGTAATLDRVDRLLDSVHAIVKRQEDAGHPVQRAHLSWGGDMIEGCYIYRGQNVSGLDRTSNTHRITQQIRMVAHRMGDFAAGVATFVPEVVNHTVGGNHGRTNGPNDYADPEDNFDVMAAWWAEDYTMNTPQIHWDTTDNWWIGYDVLGSLIISLHGDQWSGRFERLETLLPRWVTDGEFGGRPAMVLTHHRHELRSAEVNGIPVYQNGTLDGGSQWYKKAYGGSSTAGQRLLVMSERYTPESVWAIKF